MKIDFPENVESPAFSLGDYYCPEIVSSAKSFAAAIYQHSTITLKEFEAARVVTALINGCLLCREFRAEHDLQAFFAHFGGDYSASVVANGDKPTEDFYKQILDWRSSDIFSKRERLSMEFAERMAKDPQGLSLDSAFWNNFKTLFSDSEIVNLTYAVACWMGMGRATHVLGLDQACSL